MIFDTHCHYNLAPLFETWEQKWQKAQEHDVTRCIVVGTDLETSQRALDLSSQNSAFQASVAIHPSEYQYFVEKTIPNQTQVDEVISQQIMALRAMLKNDCVVAIGETGLDYFRLPTDTSTAARIKDVQKQALTAHLELAAQVKLPLIIHVRDRGEDAYHDLLTALKTFQQPLPSFILHCVSGPESYIKEALELGAYLGVAGNSTYKTAQHLRNLVRLAPSNRLLLETDAPFLPPQEFRGQTCEPWMITITAQFVRDELNLDLDQLYQNASQLFSSHKPQTTK